MKTRIFPHFAATKKGCSAFGQRKSAIRTANYTENTLAIGKTFPYSAVHAYISASLQRLEVVRVAVESEACVGWSVYWSVYRLGALRLGI
jgi:hypothetical protein